MDVDHDTLGWSAPAFSSAPADRLVAGDLVVPISTVAEDELARSLEDCAGV